MLISEATIDVSLKRLAKIQMRLGLFEPKAEQPYFDTAKYGIEQIDSDAHQQLAYEAALQSIVVTAVTEPNPGGGGGVPSPSLPLNFHDAPPSAQPPAV